MNDYVECPFCGYKHDDLCDYGWDSWDDGEIVRALCHIACLSNADFEIIKVIEDKTGKQLKKDFGASKRNEMPELLKDQILSILNEHDVLSLDQILEITDYEDRSLLTGYLWVLKKKGLIESAGRGFYKRVESDGK